MKMTVKQRLSLISVRDNGYPTPKSPTAYSCRARGWSEFLWLYEDGSTGVASEKPPVPGNQLIKVVGERLTEAGRSALSQQEESRG